MKQAVMTGPGHIELRQVPDPSPGPGEVLLRIRRIGICGSDVHVWRGRHPFTRYPVVQGHEFCGEVAGLGPGVVGLEKGVKATALPQVTCGRCGPCQRGDYHICERLLVRGFQAPGCAQEFFLVPAEQLVPLPDEFSFEQGAMVEPLAVAVHAAARAGDLAGRNVAVLGAGPIGNLVGQVAASEGAAKVLVSDLSDYRLQVARRCGLEDTSNAGQETLADAAERVFGREGFSVAFECAGVAETFNWALENVGKGGTIVVVGVFQAPATVQLSLVQDRELTIRGTLMYKREDYERAVELIFRRSVQTEPLMSQHFPLNQLMAAYEHIDRDAEHCMKVFIDV